MLILKYHKHQGREKVEASFQMELRYQLAQMTYRMAEILARESDATGYEISYHSGHRPTHTFGGKQFTFAQMKTMGVEDMLNDYNCRHWKFPVIVGVTPPKYSIEELANLEAAESVKHEWDGKEYTLYELGQKKNEYNRKINKVSREIMAFAALGNTEKEEKAKIKLADMLEPFKMLGELISDLIVDLFKPKPDAQQGDDAFTPLEKTKPISPIPPVPEPAWIIDIMQLDGISESEKYLTDRVAKLNKYITDNNLGDVLLWDQEKINKIWESCEEFHHKYGIFIDPRLMLAIIFSEGTGSFNTSAKNLAADGQHGIEKNIDLDIKKATGLILGKILGYAYYNKEFIKAVEANDNRLQTSYGDLFQYLNWNTPIIDLENGVLRQGVYAGGSEWNGNVRFIYEKLTYAGNAAEYSDYVRALDETTIINLANTFGINELIDFIFGYFEDKDGKSIISK